MPPLDDVPQAQTVDPNHRHRRQRRMVSKGVYVWTTGKKLGMFSFSGIIIGVGVVLLLCTLICLSLGVLLLVPLFGALAAAAFWYSSRVFVQAQEIEPVRPITQRTAHLLPAEESLVRASDMPSTPYTELLRAAKQGEETPAEELLRATQTQDQQK